MRVYTFAMQGARTITMIEGDGIGPEISRAVQEVFAAAEVCVRVFVCLSARVCLSLCVFVC